MWFTVLHFILAIGVIPDTEFLEESGIKLGAKGHILVNEKMQTNVANVLAVGDPIEVVDFVNKQNSTVPFLRNRIGELDKGKEILEYCQIGLRGYVASRFLTQNGFKVKNINGGYVSVLRSQFKTN